MQTSTGSAPAATTREMPPVAADTSLPPAPTIVAPVGDGCPSCGSVMAADQRYCVDCGERRGEPRLPFMDGRTVTDPPAPAPVPAPATNYAPPPEQPRGKWSSGMALLATVGLLLLSMGVGVLIGNNGDGGDPAAAQQPVIIGAAAGATAATAAPTEATGAGAKKDASASGTEDKAGVDADAVAEKNGVKLAPKDVKVGDKCAQGSVGCEGGEFTGDYFGE